MTSGIKLVAILLAAIAILSHHTPAEAQTLRRVAGLSAFDANGKKVGDVLGFTQDVGNPAVARPVVALSAGNTPFTLTMRSERFAAGPGGGEGLLWFESTNCTGTPFTGDAAVVDVEQALQRFFLHPETQVVYVPVGEIGQVVIGSQGTDPSNCPGGEIGQFDAIPLRPLINLKAHFVPPFSVRRAPD